MHVAPHHHRSARCRWSCTTSGIYWVAQPTDVTPLPHLPCCFRAPPQERSLQVDVHHYRPQQVHRLLVGGLAGEVDPQHCRARKTANKVVVTLRKRAAAEGAKPVTWRNLKSA